jgi:hypothetical protein
MLIISIVCNLNENLWPENAKKKKTRICANLQHTPNNAYSVRSMFYMSLMFGSLNIPTLYFNTAILYSYDFFLYLMKYCQIQGLDERFQI